MPVEVLTGFVNRDGEANGRPVGVAIDKQGAPLVADGVGNVIWRVVASSITCLTYVSPGAWGQRLEQ